MAWHPAPPEEMSPSHAPVVEAEPTVRGKNRNHGEPDAAERAGVL